MKNPHNGLKLYIGGLTNRYMTFTGNVIRDRDVQEETNGVLKFLEQYMRRDIWQKNKMKVPPTVGTKLLSDEEILIVAGQKAKNADKFLRLYEKGDASDYGSGSEADLALCNYFAFYSGGDEEIIDRLYRSSALMREKWNRDDYRNTTIKKAIALCNGVFYTGTIPKPDFIFEDDKGRHHVNCPLLAKHFREHQYMLSVRDSGRSGVQRCIYENGSYRPYKVV